MLKPRLVVPSGYDLVKVFKVIYILRVKKKEEEVKLLWKLSYFMLSALKVIFILLVVVLNSYHR